MKQQRTIGSDLMLAGGLLLFGLLLCGILLLTSRQGGSVLVRVDGRVTAEYPLNRDTTCVIEGVNGGTNLLVIENGTAFVREASCPDGLCVGMGKIRRNGQSIVCLPNRVSVEIAGGDEAEVDAVVR